MASGWGVALVVVVGVTTDHGGRESRPQGEGEQRACSARLSREEVAGERRRSMACAAGGGGQGARLSAEEVAGERRRSMAGAEGGGGQGTRDSAQAAQVGI